MLVDSKMGNDEIKGDLVYTDMKVFASFSLI